MKRLVLFCMLLIGCVPTDSKSCEFCGKWSFDRFEYAGYITADCDGMAQSYYENTAVEINAANIIIGVYDNDEKAQEILIKIDNLGFAVSPEMNAGKPELMLRQKQWGK